MSSLNCDDIYFCILHSLACCNRSSLALTGSMHFSKLLCCKSESVKCLTLWLRTSVPGKHSIAQTSTAQQTTIGYDMTNLAGNIGLVIPSTQVSILDVESRVTAKVITGRRSKTEAQRISDLDQAWTEPYRTVTICCARGRARFMTWLLPSQNLATQLSPNHKFLWYHESWHISTLRRKSSRPNLD